MKIQKKIICVSGILTVLSFVIVIMLEWEIDIITFTSIINLFIGKRNFLINLLMGIMTGASLSLAIAIITYSYEREKYIDDVCYFANEFISVLKKINFLYLRGDVSCIARYWSSSKYDLESLNSEKEELIKSYKKIFPESNPEMLFFIDYNKIENDLTNVIKSYSMVTGFNINFVKRLKSQNTFFIKNCNTSKNINTLFDYIQDTYTLISNKIEYMNAFNAINNLIVETNLLQKEIFENVVEINGVSYLPPKNKKIKELEDILKTIRKEETKNG